MTVGTVLLHLCTPGEWRRWLGTGAVAPSSLDEVGFVHLSAPDQVALPAQRLFAGRTDLVLLVLDPARIDVAGVDVRWEPGVPTDPASMRFPHAYGAVPASAVLMVLPYRPGPDGFAAPEVPEPGAAARAMGFEPSMLRRGATAEEPVTGGVAVRTDAWPVSRMHNQLLLGRPDRTDPATVLAEADRALTAHGLHPGALLWGPGADELADGLRAAGWSVSANEAMTAPTATGAATGAGAAAVTELDHHRPRPPPPGGPPPPRAPRGPAPPPPPRRPPRPGGGGRDAASRRGHGLARRPGDRSGPPRPRARPGAAGPLPRARRRARLRPARAGRGRRRLVAGLAPAQRFHPGRHAPRGHRPTPVTPPDGGWACPGERPGGQVPICSCCH